MYLGIKFQGLCRTYMHCLPFKRSCVSQFMVESQTDESSRRQSVSLALCEVPPCQDFSAARSGRKRISIRQALAKHQEEAPHFLTDFRVLFLAFLSGPSCNPHFSPRLQGLETVPCAYGRSKPGGAERSGRSVPRSSTWPGTRTRTGRFWPSFLGGASF